MATAPRADREPLSLLGVGAALLLAEKPVGFVAPLAARDQPWLSPSLKGGSEFAFQPLTGATEMEPDRPVAPGAIRGSDKREYRPVHRKPHSLGRQGLAQDR